MSTPAIEREVVDLLREEVRVAEARLSHATDSTFANRYRAEIRLKTAALLLIGGADPSDVPDKIEGLQ